MPTTRTEPETLRTNDVPARLNVSRSSLHRAAARTERSRSRSSSASTPSAGAGPTSTRRLADPPAPNPFAAGEVERHHDAIQRRAETLRAELAPLDDAQLCDVIANGDSDRGLQARPVLAARSEQAEKTARLALRDARDVEIIAAVLSGESHKAVAARHGISAAHARRITQQAREAQPPRSKPPRSKPPREPKPQQRRALRTVSNEPADPLTAAERLLGPWRDALPDDRIAVNDGDTIPRPDPPTLFGLFYDGKVNVIAGSPTTGKSYAALAAAADAAKAGRVMWLDAEDSRETF